MMKTQTDRTGLRKRPTFEGIVDYLASGQEKVKFPDREAKFIRNHPYLTQLDGEGMHEMEVQQENAWREQETERRVKDMSSKGFHSVPELRTETRKSSGVTSNTQFFDLGKQDVEMTEGMDWEATDSRKRKEEMHDNDVKRRGRTMEVVRAHLEYISETSGFTHFAASQAAKREPRSRTPPGVKDEKVKPEVKQEIKQIKQEVMKEEFGGSAPSAQKRVLGQGSSAQMQAPKQRQQVPPSLPPPPKRVARGRGRAASEDVQISGTNANKSTDMNFWAQQSANELRSQITFRQGRRADWAVKTHGQLLDIIRDMIKKGTW